MKMVVIFIVSLLLLNVKLSLQVSTCPDVHTSGVTKPLYVITLLPFPRGLSLLSGHRIARDEINNRTDLLPGYHIELIVKEIEDCSVLEAGLGLSNLLKYTVTPPCLPVVVVAGLVCSSHTSVLSPVAGHDGFSLIQLSAANSPIFETQNNRFPHLWRFSGSAIVYSDTVVAIMDYFNWTRIGILYNVGSVFHSEIARNLHQKITSSKNLTFSFGLQDLGKLYIKTAISNIIDTETTIVVSLLDEHQTEVLLSETLKRGLVYPRYTWIHIEKLQSYYESSKLRHEVYNATRGHMYLFVQREPEQNDTIMLSGKTYATLRRELSEDFTLLKEIYNESRSSPLGFVNACYDQLWAMALALDKAFPILRGRNFTIDNYTIGQNDITAVMEEQMANLSFQGAGGWIKFNQHRGVSTPVEVYWILDDGKQEHVGIYDPLNPSDFCVHINASKLPNDILQRTYKLIHIPLPVVVVFYILTGAVIIFITIQLIVYFYYREHKVIKATSPYLSLLMFVGCYLLCFSTVLLITYNSSFETSPRIYALLFRFAFVGVVNGYNFILSTLFLKLLRVKHVFNFSSKLRSHLGKRWSNVSLFFIIMILTVIINLILVLILVQEQPLFNAVASPTKSSVYNTHLVLSDREIIVRVGLLVAYLVIFFLVIVYLAIRTRKIEYRNFKDTKKILVFLLLFFILAVLSGAGFRLLSLKNQVVQANILLISCSLCFPLLCQLVLFTTKVLPVVNEKLFQHKLFQRKWCALH